MKLKREPPKKIYFYDLDHGRYYVYYVQYGPIKTLFDVVATEELAKQAIKDHKAGRHSTQWVPGK